MSPEVLAATITASATVLAAIVAGILNLVYAKKNLEESRRLSSPDQGRELPTHLKASGEIIECIESELKKLNNRRGGEKKILRLKFIGVSMSFSWATIVEGKLEELVKNNPNIIFVVEGAFVDHRYLSGLQVRPDKPWAEISEHTEEQFVKFGQRMKKEYGDRFDLRVIVCNTLPQWHGWLVSDAYLYLGRVRFEFVGNERPSLQVGENEYRYFYKTPTGFSQGDIRIDLFTNWLKFLMFDNSKCDYSYNRLIYWDKVKN